MTCPTCGGTRAVLIACADAFHSTAAAPRTRVEPVSVSVAHPEDFVRQEPNAAVGRTSVYSHPYSTPVPTAHDGSTGWIFCNTCESPQPVSGHECAPEQPTHEDCLMCHFPVLHDGHGWVCSGCAPEEDRKRVIRRAARGGGR